MPHLRKRYLRPVIEKLTHFSPIVGLLGHRQVGKTTLLGFLSNDISDRMISLPLAVLV